MTDPLDRTRYPVDPWRLIETAPPADATHSETVFALGNGFVGLRGVRDEDEPTPACFVNGFYETWPIKYPEDAFGLARVGQTIQPAPSPTLQVTVDGHRLGVGQPLAQSQELDLRTGVLTRKTTWGTPSGSVLVRAQRLVSFARRGLVASLVEVTPQRGVEISVEQRLELPGCGPSNSRGLDPRVGTVLTDPAIEIVQRQTGQDWLALGVQTIQAGRQLLCVVNNELRTDGVPVVPTATVADHGVQASWTCPPDESINLVSLVWYELDGGEAAIDDARSQLELARTLGWDALVDEQTAWLSDFWSLADVQVDDAALQQAIRWSTFQTIQAAARADGHGVAAKGVTGSGYDGHYFWDMEMYVLPFLTYTHPEAARAALGFRLATLPQALDRASELGIGGALFPWRTIDGREASAYFPAGTAQYHIDADVAHAFAQYVAATGDDSILRDGGAELIIETARMWASRGFWGDDGLFHLHYVTGPDEYTALVDDNVYTNVMARANLRFAADVAEGLVHRRVEGISVAGGVPGGDACGILPPPNTSGASYTGAPSDRSGDTPKPPLVENLPPVDFAGTGGPKRSGGAAVMAGGTPVRAGDGADAYPSLVATQTVRRVRRLCARGRLEPDSSASTQPLASTALFVEEIAEWRRIADGMCVPFDAAKGVHPQDAHFLGREPWDIASIPPENFPLLLHYHPLTIYRRQVLKQADVVLAQIICSDDFTAAEKFAAFDYYDPLTTGDSTLSAVPQAIAAAHVGHLELACDYLERATYVDLANSHGNTDAGVHVAVAAGVWNVLVSGFGGLRDAAWGNQPSGGLTLDPQLPPGWAYLRFAVLYHGTKLNVEVTPGGVTLTADGPVSLTVWGQPVTVVPGQSTHVAARDH